MAHLKITEPGWEKYTGSIGSVDFVDAVSIDHVSPRDAARIAGSMRAEFVETGVNPSVSQAMVDMMHVPAPVDPGLESPVEGKVEEPAQPVAAVAYTREQLEKLADEKGIKGVREIAEPMGVRNTSIAGLIDEILAKQAELAAAAPANPA